MTLYKQDVLDLAALETQMADKIYAQAKGSMIQLHPALYYAMRTCSARALAMATIADTLPEAPTSGTGTPTPSPTPTPTPTPSGPDTTTIMPAPQPNGSWVATGRVIKIDFEQDPPGNSTPSWNQRFHSDQTTESLGLFDDQSPQSTSSARTPFYLKARTGNTADANGYGTMSNPSNSGNLPDNVNISNHTNYAGYPINDAIAGAVVGYAYDVEFYGSRQEAGSITAFDVGDPGHVVLPLTLDISFNTSRKAVASKVLPAPNGQLYWTWYTAPSNTSESGKCAMGALILREYRPA
ncbi:MULTISPECIES: hypothetical protein [unclassified Sphingomonas]|uniref:hypothetical protein n=1 Tax=unclassified Sphingomonas TaxID=196159 RepID=UPI00226A8181|nr:MULTISPECIES: hypothetical protein [unclassified Sphingomonas]